MSQSSPCEFVFDNHMQQVAEKPTKRKSESQKAEERLAQQYGVCAVHKRQKRKVRTLCPIIICHQLIRRLKCLCNVPEEELALVRKAPLDIPDDVLEMANDNTPDTGVTKLTSEESRGNEDRSPSVNCCLDALPSLRDGFDYPRWPMMDLILEDFWENDLVTHEASEISWNNKQAGQVGTHSKIHANGIRDLQMRTATAAKNAKSLAHFLNRLGDMKQEAKQRLDHIGQSRLDSMQQIRKLRIGQVLASFYLQDPEDANSLALESATIRSLDRQALDLREKLKVVDKVVSSYEEIQRTVQLQLRELRWLLQIEERVKEEVWAWQNCSIMYDIDTASFLALATRIKQSATACPPERDKDPPSKYCTELLAQSGFQSEIWEFYARALIQNPQAPRTGTSQSKISGNFDQTVSKMRAHLQTAIRHVDAGIECGIELSRDARANTVALLRQIPLPTFNSNPEAEPPIDPTSSSFRTRNITPRQTAVA